MAEYTYKDIIIDPTSEEAKNAVGEGCYFGSNPKTVLDFANCNEKKFLRVLECIKPEEDNPFYDYNYGFPCIILKKEEPKPSCIPFENGREFFNSYLSVESRLEKEDYFLSNHGIWLKDKDIDDVFYIVTEIWKDGVVLGSDQSTTKWDDLLCGYTFLDSSPCGRFVKESGQ